MFMGIIGDTDCGFAANVPSHVKSGNQFGCL